MTAPHAAPLVASATAVHFFRNYNRVVGAAYVAIVLLTLGFFLHQISEKQDEELAVIQGHVDRHSQFIEFVLRSSLDYLELMRTSARAGYAVDASKSIAEAADGISTKAEFKGQFSLFSLLQENPDGTAFSLDALPARDDGGNLTGVGRLTGRSPAFYRDVTVALGLNATFQAITFNLPSAATASFCSVEGFDTTSPWQESRNRSFSAADWQRPVWRMGTPAQNLNREKYWAPVQFGGADVGLLVPAGAPVYNGDDFRGVVSIATSLDYLNRINADFGYPLGQVFVVDAYGAVLAHPHFSTTALEAQATQPLTALMPPGILNAQRQLKDLPSGVATDIAGHWVVRHGFVSAPWQLVYTVPTRTLWWTLVRERGGAMLAMLLGLTALMIVTYAVTTREFIAPASKLVKHLATESTFQPSPIPWVPSAWRPWFQAISDAFQASLQLAGLRQELDIAAKMQQAILPRHWPVHRDFSLWGAMRSAKEVGGDFYDHFPLADGKIGIVVADVSGKGVPAALFGMVSKTLLRATAIHGADDLGATLTAVNDSLCEDNDTCMFVTTFYAVFDPAQGSLRFVNGGHPPPLLVHADGSNSFLPMTGGIALGVMDGMPFASQSLQLTPGDCVIIYTDGVTEAFNPKDEEFTPERLPPLFNHQPLKDVHDAVNRLIAAVDQFADGAPQSDDITCVALMYQPAHPAAKAEGGV